MFSFLKKKPVDTIAPPPPPSPVSRFDTKLESKAPSALPPLPPLPKPAAVPSPLPPLPKLEMPKMDVPKPAPLPSLPKIEPRPVTKLGDVPPISVAPSVPPPLPKIELPKPIAAPVQPVPAAPPAVQPAAQPKPVKLENSKLAKALEELNAMDFDLSEPAKAAPAAPARVAVTPAPAGAKGPLFVSLVRFDEALIEIKTTTENLAHLQSKNERLGMIETQTKAQLDALVNSFEYVQRHILVIDEKMFKVN